MEKVLLVNYKLKLLKGLRLHSIFYVLLLEPALGNTPIEKLDIQQEGLEEHKVKQILAIRKSDKGHLE